MRLFKMLMNRRRKFKTWFNGKYIHGEYKISLFNIFSKYIMFDILNMNYYWSYHRGLGFDKIYNIEYLLKGGK